MTKEIGIKTKVARRLGIPYDRVIRYTKDINVRNQMFSKKTMNLLKELMEKGYVEGFTCNFSILAHFSTR